jgi:hypothetical protein
MGQFLRTYVAIALSLHQRAYWVGARQMKKTKIIIAAVGLVLFGFVLAKMGWTGVFIN